MQLHRIKANEAMTNGRGIVSLSNQLDQSWKEGIMTRSGGAKRNIRAGMTAILVVVFLTLCFVQTASSEQKSTTTNPATTATKPVSQSKGTPQQAVTDKSVDMVAVLKNQLKQCEADMQQLDKDNDALRKKNSDLQKEKDALQQQRDVLQKQVNNCTKVGGSGVKSYCEGTTISHNTAGGTNNCAATGYLCEPVSGLCRTNCSATSGQCANGFVCDTMYGQCIKQ